MTRNSAGFSPCRGRRRSDGVGACEEEFIPGRVGPRRSQAGRLPKEEAPPVHRTHRGAAMAWLAGPSRAGEDIVSLNLIIQAAESGFNELPCSTPLYALGAGRLARVARGDKSRHRGDGQRVDERGPSMTCPLSDADRADMLRRGTPVSREKPWQWPKRFQPNAL